MTQLIPALERILDITLPLTDFNLYTKMDPLRFNVFSVNSAKCLPFSQVTGRVSIVTHSSLLSQTGHRLTSPWTMVSRLIPWRSDFLFQYWITDGSRSRGNVG